MTCGIYLGAPISASTNKVYIGQSINIEDRVRKHTYRMIKGIHTTKMQEAYKEYGEFEWEVLKECTEIELDDLEKYYIKLFNAYSDGLNTYEEPHSSPILYGTDNGRVTKDRIILCKSILDITLSNPTYCIKEIAKATDTEEHIISHVWYGPLSNWLTETFPVEYAQVRNLAGIRQAGGRSAKQQGKSYPRVLSPDFKEYAVENVRQFAAEHNLDKGDLNKVLNKVNPSVKGWIIKDLDLIDPGLHTKFYATKRGHYRKQFDLYKNI